MVVPYGSPDPGHARKNVFDIGEYGLGKLANSLKLGCDCLGHIAYLDAHLNTMAARSSPSRKGHLHPRGRQRRPLEALGLPHRADRGAARPQTGDLVHLHGRQLRIRLLLVFEAGRPIEFEMKATGIINTVACLPGQPSKYGTEVCARRRGAIHQHAFCARLDMAVDGDRNSVVECNTYAEPPGPKTIPTATPSSSRKPCSPPSAPLAAAPIRPPSATGR
jgi:primary-amine oxidase